MIHIKAPFEVPMMRESGRLLADIIEEVRSQVRVGVSPLELDEVCARAIRAGGARPAFLGYDPGWGPFPNVVCSSRNQQVVHGIPDDLPLVEGDLISLDFGIEYRGYFADSAFSVYLGDAPPVARKLLDVTERALYMAVSQARPGARLGDIGHTIQSICESEGLGVVRDFVGHGIGRALHEDPAVPNYGKAGTGVLLKPGMCLAIEPMTTLGDWRTRTLEDRWTVVTADGSLSAHFEHTVLVTESEPEILTRARP